MTITLTTQAVQAAQAQQVQPEFARAKQIFQMFGIKYGTLYNLMNDGKIKGVLLRSRGSKSGIRLFNVDSVREYIKSMESEQTNNSAAE